MRDVFYASRLSRVLRRVCGIVLSEYKGQEGMEVSVWNGSAVCIPLYHQSAV